MKTIANKICRFYSRACTVLISTCPFQELRVPALCLHAVCCRYKGELKQDISPFCSRGATEFRVAWIVIKHQLRSRTKEVKRQNSSGVLDQLGGRNALPHSFHVSQVCWVLQEWICHLGKDGFYFGIKRFLRENAPFVLIFTCFIHSVRTILCLGPSPKQEVVQADSPQVCRGAARGGGVISVVKLVL